GWYKSITCKTKQYKIANGNRRKVYGPIRLPNLFFLCSTKMRQRAQDSRSRPQFIKVTKTAARIFKNIYAVSMPRKVMLACYKKNSTTALFLGQSVEILTPRLLEHFGYKKFFI
ncbi:hypothetical protein CEXT_482781, partial [Caerostris extrusa]